MTCETEDRLGFGDDLECSVGRELQQLVTVSVATGSPKG
jgi:hypothetical protein